MLLAEFTKLLLTSVSADRVSAEVEAPADDADQEWYLGARVVAELARGDSAEIQVDVTPAFATSVQNQFPRVSDQVAEYEDLATVIVHELYNTGVNVGPSPHLQLNVLKQGYAMMYLTDENAARVSPQETHEQ